MPLESIYFQVKLSKYIRWLQELRMYLFWGRKMNRIYLVLFSLQSIFCKKLLEKEKWNLIWRRCARMLILKIWFCKLWLRKVRKKICLVLNRLKIFTCMISLFLNRTLWLAVWKIKEKNVKISLMMLFKIIIIHLEFDAFFLFIYLCYEYF